MIFFFYFDNYLNIYEINIIILSLKVCEDVALEGSIFDDGQNIMVNVHNFEEAKVFMSQENAITKVEERVKVWIKKLKDFMAESKQVKRENDNSGPQQELEYWKRRGAQFSQLVCRLQVPYFFTNIFTFYL